MSLIYVKSSVNDNIGGFLMDQQFYLIVVNLNSDKLTSSVELLTLEDYLWDLKENTLSIQIQPVITSYSIHYTKLYD